MLMKFKLWYDVFWKISRKFRVFIFDPMLKNQQVEPTESFNQVLSFPKT